MAKKTQQEALLDLYNTLSNDELQDLINMATNRLFIYNPNDQECYDIDWVSKNGPRLQINLIKVD